MHFYTATEEDCELDRLQMMLVWFESRRKIILSRFVLLPIAWYMYGWLCLQQANAAWTNSHSSYFPTIEQVDAALPAAVAKATGGDLTGAIEGLLPLEKKARIVILMLLIWSMLSPGISMRWLSHSNSQASDSKSTSRILEGIIQMCFDLQNWDAMCENLLLLSKRRGALKMVMRAFPAVAAWNHPKLEPNCCFLCCRCRTILWEAEWKVYIFTCDEKRCDGVFLDKILQFLLLKTFTLPEPHIFKFINRSVLIFFPWPEVCDISAGSLIPLRFLEFRPRHLSLDLQWCGVFCRQLPKWSKRAASVLKKRHRRKLRWK